MTAAATNGRSTSSVPAPKAATPAPARPSSRLGAVKVERLRSPVRVFLYGESGVGKSTLAAGAPSPIWLDTEDGSARLRVARYPFREGKGGHVPRSYVDVLAALDDLAISAHTFETLVIDTVDRLEKMIWAHLLERDN